jgi:hypothetical protein
MLCYLCDVIVILSLAESLWFSNGIFEEILDRKFSCFVLFSQSTHFFDQIILYI